MAPEPSSDAILIIDPSPAAATLTAPPVAAAGCRHRTVASMTEALDVVRAFAPAMMLADVGAAPPRPERVSEAARQAGTIPLVMMGARETPSETIEAWANLGATDCVMRPLRLVDVQVRLAAARAALKPDGKKAPRRVLLASDDGIDLRRLDALLQLNGFYVLPVDLSTRSLDTHEEFDVLLVASRSPVAPLLQGLKARSNLAKVPAVVLSAQGEVPGAQSCLHVNAPADDVVRAVSGDRRVHPQLRVHQRVPFFAPVEFRETSQPSGRWLTGYTSNLSPGGLFIRSLAAGRVGSALEVRIHLGKGREVLEGSAVVSWSNAWGRSGFHFSVGMGVQFIAMPAPALMRVRELCGN